MSNQDYQDNQQTPENCQRDQQRSSRLKGDNTEDGHYLNQPLPKSISQDVYNRLNINIQRTNSEPLEDLAVQQLGQIGRLIQIWRIKQGYTRVDLAEKLALDVDRLLFIEHGIGLPADLMEAHLLKLLPYLTSEALDRELKARIERYLDSQRPAP